MKKLAKLAAIILLSWAVLLFLPSAAVSGGPAGETVFISEFYPIAGKSYGYLPGSFNYYNQLDNGQKVIYNALKNISPSTSKIDITLYEPITFTASSKDPTDAEIKPASYKIARQVQGALDALLKDYPEIFWLKFGADGSGYPPPVFSGVYSNGKWVFTTNTVKFIPVLMDTYIPMKDDMVQALNNAVNSFPVEGGTRYEKVLSIHDRLANTVAYDTSYSFERAHDAYGALIDGLAVCEGYAEAFKLICDREGIPCVLVVGGGVPYGGTPEPHMWNMVKMEDGKWYGVDVTWDDRTEAEEHSGIYYDFFLVGKNTKDRYFGKRTFAQSHIADGNFSGSEFSPEFSYPPQSPEKYVPGSGVTEPSEPTDPSGSPSVIIPNMPKGTTQPQAVITPNTTKAKTTKKATATAPKTTSRKTDASKTSTTTTTVTTSSQSDTMPMNITESSSGLQTAGGAGGLSILDIAPFALAGVIVVSIAVILIIVIVKKRE